MFAAIDVPCPGPVHFSHTADYIYIYIYMTLRPIVRPKCHYVESSIVSNLYFFLRKTTTLDSIIHLAVNRHSILCNEAGHCIICLTIIVNILHQYKDKRI